MNELKQDAICSIDKEKQGLKGMKIQNGTHAKYYTEGFRSLFVN